MHMYSTETNVKHKNYQYNKEMALVTDQKYFADISVCTQMLGCLFLSAANGLYLLYFLAYNMAALPQLIQSLQIN